ncbi:pyruvate carboxylase subunit B [Reichenbachiella faecimaris]|uniref:Pyruvate carboxylase subunit B n=1 Tax=Reichenbachiella faecimaris TaxID=692418 RepID=A0A1W2GHP4_REIFA|nr:biotin/lipoyl-containing protein [Reichenbachiella faecimaris]SMD36091.1 pyruvate carboxylase subunit B [Reichenbachiella faecimaris]
MGREIGLCLVYRDMWQSSGKYMPRVDQLVKVAEPIIDMGCFRRVETNGGGFEQINLLYGENPNISNRAWTQPFNDAGIQTQMLERGLNALRMYPVADDVRKLMFKVKKLQGTDISRSFDGLNDARNLEKSIDYAKAGGMISQTCLCITYSKIHTVDYYIKKAEELINLGAEEICIKDMAGIGRPVSLGKIVAGIKEIKPDILVQYHGHSGPGFSVTSSLEAVRAGADIVDVAVEPLSWGTVHADLLTVHEVLKDAGYSLPGINMKAYMQVRTLTQEFIDDFLGYYINPKNRLMNSLLIAPGLPGGMMGSLMADLENNLKSLNKWMEKNNKPLLSQDDLLIKLFDEVQHVWPMMGYPPLVTPYSQYVKNAALVNVMQMEKGKARWSLLDDNTWDMMLGKSGRLPGEVSEDLKNLAAEQGREFFEGDPSELVPDCLDELRKEMDENGWDTGEDDEELLEYALHPQQYLDYKSGKAKADFETDLAQRRAEENTPPTSTIPGIDHTWDLGPKSIQVDVNGERFNVNISYDDHETSASQSQETSAAPPYANGHLKEILAPLEGKVFLTKDPSETAKKVGDTIQEGDVICYIEAMKVVNAVKADQSGTIAEVCIKDGEDIFDDDVLFKLN